MSSLRDFSPWASTAMGAANETKFGTSVACRSEDDARTSNTRIARTQRRESARYHALATMKNMACVIRERTTSNRINMSDGT